MNPKIKISSCKKFGRTSTQYGTCGEIRNVSSPSEFPDPSNFGFRSHGNIFLRHASATASDASSMMVTVISQFGSSHHRTSEPLIFPVKINRSEPSGFRQQSSKTKTSTDSKFGFGRSISSVYKNENAEPVTVNSGENEKPDSPDSSLFRNVNEIDCVPSKSSKFCSIPLKYIFILVLSI